MSKAEEIRNRVEHIRAQLDGLIRLAESEDKTWDEPTDIGMYGAIVRIPKGDIQRMWYLHQTMNGFWSIYAPEGMKERGFDWNSVLKWFTDRRLEIVSIDRMGVVSQ